MVPNPLIMAKTWALPVRISGCLVEWGAMLLLIELYIAWVTSLYLVLTEFNQITPNNQIIFNFIEILCFFLNYLSKNTFFCDSFCSTITIHLSKVCYSISFVNLILLP